MAASNKRKLDEAGDTIADEDKMSKDIAKPAKRRRLVLYLHP